MNFSLTELPYGYNALEPFISRKTLEIHHTKHHKGYVDKLDAELADDPLRDESLENILLSSNGHRFNLAAQVWNHDFYWRSLSPSPVSLSPDGELHSFIKETFGALDAFYEEFKEAAANEFGSGWAWIAFNPASRKLEVFSTTDALNPLTNDRVPLLTLDVWEHAYYLDYQNERGRYIDTFLERHINWAFAEENLLNHLSDAA